MRQELELLLDQSVDYQDRPLEWAEAWYRAASQFSLPCFRSDVVIAWSKWYQEVNVDRPGLTVEIIKQSVVEAMTGRSAPGRNFGADIRFEVWRSREWKINDYRAMCQELIDLHKDFNLGCAGFESYNQWLAVLLKGAPRRQISL